MGLRENSGCIRRWWDRSCCWSPQAWIPLSQGALSNEIRDPRRLYAQLCGSALPRHLWQLLLPGNAIAWLLVAIPFCLTAAASASSRWSIWWTGGLLVPLPVAVLGACFLPSSRARSLRRGCLPTKALGNWLQCVNYQITWGWMRAWCLITMDRLFCLRPCLMHSAARQCSGQIFVRSLYKSLELCRSALLGNCAYTCLAPPSFGKRL